MEPQQFSAFLDQLRATARTEPDVEGLVVFGSTADRRRRDHGSDHDFAWIVRPGTEQRFRDDLSWLPEADRIVASAVAAHGGVTVLYEDGHRMEFGVAHVDAFATWAGGPAEVLIGGAGVRDAVARVIAHRPDGPLDPHREFVLFLTQLLSGVGRAHRGEVTSAAGLIRYEAVNHLLRALAATSSPGDSRLDPLDPRRRADTVLPAATSAIERASRLDPLSAAAALLAVAEDHLQASAAFDRRAIDVARRRMHGDASGGVQGEPARESEQHDPRDPVQPPPGGGA